MKFPTIRRWRSLQTLVHSLPPGQLLPLGLAIFALFSILGPMTDLLGGARTPWELVAGNTLVAGMLGVAYALSTMRRNWWLLAGAIGLQVGWAALQGAIAPRLGRLPPADVTGRLTSDALVTLSLVVGSYSCFLWFINGTAARFLRAQAEIMLAREIHRVLVPDVNTRIGEYQFAGFSLPSGEVGGDLVDVVNRPGNGWIGYVADVTGHGVSSGLVMGMFKSALHMRLLAGGSLTGLLQDLNTVLVPLKQTSMFVTFACVRVTRAGGVEFAVAGHLPILRVRAGTAIVEEITTPQIPIGMFADYEFTSAAMDCEAGDLLVILTDGLTEVFDRADREFGMEGVKRIVAESAGAPLATIGQRLLAASRAQGAQIDDQTLLLIRRT